MQTFSLLHTQGLMLKIVGSSKFAEIAKFEHTSLWDLKMAGITLGVGKLHFWFGKALSTQAGCTLHVCKKCKPQTSLNSFRIAAYTNRSWFVMFPIIQHTCTVCLQEQSKVDERMRFVQSEIGRHYGYSCTAYPHGCCVVQLNGQRKTVKAGIGHCIDHDTGSARSL